MRHRRHQIVKQEWIGNWRLRLFVTGHGRFVLHAQFPGEPSWTRSKFYSSSAQAEHEFYKWRDELIVKLAVSALGISP